jgi:hypothetical protein
LTYLPAAGGPYQSDDYPNLVDNHKILLEEITLTTIKEAAFSSPSSLFGRPLSMLSFTINYTLSGNKDPYLVKLTNIIIHMITGIGLFLLTGILLSYLLPDTDSGRKLIPSVSLFVTTFWLLHPLYVSTVLYAVQRMTMLSAFFTVSGLITYIRLRDRTITFNRHFAWLIASLALFTALAFLSKENGALLPVFALLVELSLFRFGYHKDTGALIKIIHKLSLLVPTVFIISFLIFKFVTLTGDSAAHHFFTPEERLMSQARALIHYIGWLALLNLKPMSLYHMDFEISTGLLAPVTTLISILTVLLMLFVSAASIVKRKALVLGFGLMWFFAGHLIESTTIPLILMYEHRNYLPGYGILLVLSYYFLKTIYTRGNNKKKIILFSCILILPVFLTYERTQTWASENSLVINMLRKRPDFSWTWEEAALFMSKAGNYEDAYKAAIRAQELAPQEPTHIFTEAFLRCRHEPDKAVPEKLISRLMVATSAARFKPNDLARYVNMINACFHSGVNHEILKEIYTMGLKNDHHSFRKFSQDALSLKR